MTDPLQWWRDAIAGKKPPVTTTPECGYFVAKMSGTMIPASIWWEGPIDDAGNPCGDQELMCEIGGQQCSAEDQWLSLAKRPVTREEYDYWLSQLVAEAVR